ncbi:MAG: HEAT repeat domain-containing protein [bacterium]
MRRFLGASLVLVALVLFPPNTSAEGEVENLTRVRMVITQSYGKAGQVFLPYKDVACELLKGAKAEIVPDESQDYDVVLEIKVEGKAIPGYYDKRGELVYTSFWDEEIARNRRCFPPRFYFYINNRTIYYYEENDEEDYNEDVVDDSYLSRMSYLSVLYSLEEFLRRAGNEPMDMLFTGALLKGTITLRDKKGKVVSESFEGSMGPSNYLEGSSFYYDPPYKPSQAPFFFAFIDRGSFPDALAIAVGKFFGFNALIPALGSKDWKVKNCAFSALYEFVSQAVDYLIPALWSENSEVRVESAFLLGHSKEKRAVEPLIKALKEGDAYLRIAAASALGNLGDERAIPALMEALNDPNEELRRNAALSLGKLKAMEAIKKLKEIVENPKEGIYTREAAITALGEIGGRESADFLIHLVQTLSKEDNCVDKAHLYYPALKALAQTKDPRGIDILTKDFMKGTYISYELLDHIVKIGPPALDALLSIFQDRDYPSFKRAEIAEAIGKAGYAKAVDALVASLDEADITLVEKVKYALLKIGKPSIKPLILLLNSDNTRLKCEAINLLSSLKAWEAVEQIVSIAQNKKEPLPARTSAVRALGEFPTQKVKEVLLSISMDKKENPDLRQNAFNLYCEMVETLPEEILSLIYDANADYFLKEAIIFRLVKKKDQSAKEKILSLLRDPKVPDGIKNKCVSILALIWREEIADELVSLMEKFPSLERVVALALADLRDERAVPHLISQLENRKGTLDLELVRALQSLRSPSAIPYFLQLCRSSDPEVRKVGAEGLGEIGLPSCLEPLLALLKDEYPVVRKASALALGKVGSSKATEPLIKSLKDDYAIVREAAAIALGDIGDKRAVEYIAPLLNDRNPKVREAAVIALGKLQDPRSVPLVLQILRESIYRWDEEGRNLRREAYNALVRLGPLAVEQLLSTLQDGESSLSTLAISALGEIRDPRAVDPLLSLLEEILTYGRSRGGESLSPQTIHSALVNITHQDFGYDIALWKHWWERNKSLFLKGG